jgi:hypothetical protein
MAQGPADFFFAAKTVDERRIAFHFRVWNLDSYLLAGVEVGSLKRGCRAAAFNDRAETIVIELFAGINWSPRCHLFF